MCVEDRFVLECVLREGGYCGRWCLWNVQGLVMELMECLRQVYCGTKQWRFFSVWLVVDGIEEVVVNRLCAGLFSTGWFVYFDGKEQRVYRICTVWHIR